MTVIETDGIVKVGLAVASPQEQANLEVLTQREREWYVGYRRFETNTAVMDAILRGELVYAHPTADVTPAKRFLNPELQSTFPGFLLPAALGAYKAVGRLWRQELVHLGIDNPAYRLAGTSFVRSQEVQDRLVRTAGKLATPESSHCVGVAFDIDTSGYYEWDAGFGLRTIWHPDRKRDTAEKIGKSIGNSPLTEQSPTPYDQAAMDALKHILTGLHEDRAINYVPEFVGTANECSHVAPNPALDENDWAHII